MSDSGKRVQPAWFRGPGPQAGSEGLWFPPGSEGLAGPQAGSGVQASSAWVAGRSAHVQRALSFAFRARGAVEGHLHRVHEREVRPGVQAEDGEVRPHV